MAITFIQQRKKQQYLIIIFVLLILAIILIFWSPLFKKLEVTPPVTILEPKKVKINFEVLENPALEELQPFEKIAPFEDEIGRENPFILY